MRRWTLKVLRQFLGLALSALHILAVAAMANFKSRATLQLENLALRHQVGVLRRSVKRPRLSSADRLLWTWLCEVWSDWRSALVIVQPQTVIAWHRKGFRLFWSWKVRHGRSGRPPVSKELRELIRKMSRDNPLWGAPRIHGELLKLGIDIGETSVGKYIIRRRKPPSQTWRTFLENHVKTMVSIDFFTVPTIRFQILYVFLVLAHDRRRIVHFNVTAHPTAEWTGQQLREAFPFEQVPRYLLRDRDGIFGGEFRKDVKAMGIKEVLSTPRSPWQRAYVERVIGTIRRECLDHMIVLNEASAPPREVIPDVLSRIQNASVAGQGRAGTSACARGQPRRRHCNTSGWRTPPPLRATRSLNAAPRPNFWIRGDLVGVASAKPLPGC
jgi:transposase InsO family protein